MSLNGTLRQWIDLGFHPEVCLSNKYGCGDEGAAISFWLKIPDCDKKHSVIISTLQVCRGFGVTNNGFALYCSRRLI